MPEEGYPLAEAAADLAAAGLLADCLGGRDGAWRPLADGAGTGAGGAFLGATLDSRQVDPGALFVGLRGERTDGRDHAGAALAAGAAAVLTRPWDGPGDDPLTAAPPPARSGAAGPGPVLLLSPRPVAALGLLAGRWRARRRTPVLVAVTGSNGKTTTKDLLAAMMARQGPTAATRGNLNNELGLPLTLLSLRADHRFAAVEIGASAEGEIARLGPLAAPQVGVITNAAEAHLAEFGSLAGVIRGKGELLDALPPAGTAVLNADSPGFAAWCERAPCRVVSHGRLAGDHRWSWSAGPADGAGRIELDGRIWDLPLPGVHNGANFVAALLSARAAGVGDDAAAAALAGFRPTGHRSRLLAAGGVRLLDDSYNANPVSVLSAAAALLALPGGGRRLAALGVMAELGPDSDRLHARTGRRLREAGLDELVAVGEGAAPLAEGFRDAGGAGRHFAGKREAAAWLAGRLAAGDAVLVKGSRVAAMEDLVGMLAEALRGRDAEPGAGRADADRK